MSILHDIIATLKNAIDISDTTREGRLIISMVISLSFLFTFLAITGDIVSAGCLAAALEIVLMFMLSIV